MQKKKQYQKEKERRKEGNKRKRSARKGLRLCEGEVYGNVEYMNLEIGIVLEVSKPQTGSQSRSNQHN